MAQVEVRDYALWIKHIYGSEDLKRQLERLEPDQTVVLKVAGKEGIWRKMSAYRTSRHPTPGLSPIGPMQATWGDLYRHYKPLGGGVVDIELVKSTGSPVDRIETPARWEVASEAEREAAWEAFKALSRAGWRSESPYGPRNELYDRDDE